MTDIKNRKHPSKRYPVLEKQRQGARICQGGDAEHTTLKEEGLTL